VATFKPQKYFAITLCCILT